MAEARTLQAIVEERGQNVPRLQAMLDAWAATEQLTDQLAADLAAARQHDVVDGSITEPAQRLSPAIVGEQIREVEASIRTVLTRFQRGTVNIGVSGAARMGKSTLLQSLSGLGDDQIPTGKGVPVTAGRSQIYNNPTESSALISFHSWQSFRQEVLDPLHASIGHAAPALASPSAWRAVDYAGLRAAANNEGEFNANLTRVTELQASLGSFEDLLGSPARRVQLEGLRPYVAYPRQQDVQGGVADRKYAAVRSAQVECPFPQTGVDKLGLVDLPGLGEIDPRAEEHHVTSLSNEVDLVLILKRPESNATSFWSKADGQAFNLIQTAHSGAFSSSDFCILALNTGSTDPELAQTLRHDIATNAPKVDVLELDASDSGAVAAITLPALLTHLSGRLPSMDAALRESVSEQSRQLAAALRRAVTDLRAALRAPKLSGSADGRLQALAVEAHESIGADLFALEARLFSAIDDDAQKSTFIDEVTRCYEAAREWIDAEAFDDDDKARLLRRMQTNKDSGGAGSAELNRLRIAVSDFFAQVDNHFAGEITLVAQDVRDLLSARLPHLVTVTGDAVFDLLALTDILEAGDEPATNLAEAIRELCSVSFNFRTHMYPDVRDVIRNLLEWQYRDEETGELRPLVTVDFDEAGVEQLISTLRSQARKVAYHCQKELIARAETPARLLHAVTEHFADRAVRHAASASEFQQIGRSYRDTLWPNEFDRFASTRKISASLRDTQQQLLAAIEPLAEGN